MSVFFKGILLEVSIISFRIKTFPDNVTHKQNANVSNLIATGLEQWKTSN
jgi:hypothetical protein